MFQLQKLNNTESDKRIITNGKWVKICKMVMAYFKVLFQHSSTELEAKHEKHKTEYQ
jgi:hypothetical protein